MLILVGPIIVTPAASAIRFALISASLTAICVAWFRSSAAFVSETVKYIPCTVFAPDVTARSMMLPALDQNKEVNHGRFKS